MWNEGKSVKKIITASIVSVMLLSGLTACGGSQTTNQSAPAASSAADGNTVTVTATNFKFEPAEIHVKKGDKVTLKLANKQGMHGLAVPELKVDLKKDGDTATFTADKTGAFDFQCSVMCGAGHTDMKGKIVVE
jgi:cytochrome c oxidase subunit 2